VRQIKTLRVYVYVARVSVLYKYRRLYGNDVKPRWKNLKITAWKLTWFSDKVTVLS